MLKEIKPPRIPKRGIEESDTNAAASVTDLGDASRDITDTADVTRASIAKGRGTVENRTAADIATGKINGNESIIQGITQDNTNSVQKVPQSTCVVVVSPNLTARVCNPNPNLQTLHVVYV
jgi:hypothetical protein